MTSPPLPSVEQAAQLRDAALGQLEFTRRYTLELLETVDHPRWFEIPPGAPGHLAWHVGHLAVSEYGLLMYRQRGRAPGDLDLIPGHFRRRYGRGTTPNPDPDGQPTPAELLDRLATVHAAARAEIEEADPERLLEPTEMPYAVYPLKLGALLFCPLHEQIHAGQIGLTRRLLGLEPVR